VPRESTVSPLGDLQGHPVCAAGRQVYGKEANSLMGEMRRAIAREEQTGRSSKTGLQTHS
jgi:hypothetical protein